MAGHPGLRGLRYDGRAELLGADGEVIDTVHVALYSDSGWSELHSWWGLIGPGEDGAGEWVKATQLRLPQDRIASIAVAAINDSHEGWSGRLVGSGPPPF